MHLMIAIIAWMGRLLGVLRALGRPRPAPALALVRIQPVRRRR